MCIFFSIWFFSCLRVYIRSKEYYKGKHCKKDNHLNLCEEEEKDEQERKEILRGTQAGVHYLHNTSSENLSKEISIENVPFPLWVKLIKSVKPMTITGPQSFIRNHQI